jgi:hypothetical protein
MYIHRNSAGADACNNSVATTPPNDKSFVAEMNYPKKDEHHHQKTNLGPATEEGASKTSKKV